MKRYSLVSRLIAMSTLIILLTVITLSSVVYYGTSTKIKQQVHKNLAGVAEFKANQIIHTLDFERVNLLAWRTSAVMVDVIVDDLDKRIEHELINLKINYQLLGQLYVFNQQGILIASSQSNVLGQKLPAEWRLSQEEYQFVPQHSVDFIEPSNIITAFVTKLAIPGMSQQGYLVLTHPWSDLWQKLLSQEYQFAFFDKESLRLERATKDGIKQLNIAQNFEQQETWVFDGKHYLGFISDDFMVGRFVFQIAAFISEDKADKPLFELLKELNIAACIVILPIILLTIALSHRFIAPIKRLTKTIRRIEQSKDLTIKVSIRGKDEVADLADAFNLMVSNLAKAFQEREKIAQELEDLNQSLEHKVKDRTQELVSTVDQLKSAQLQLVQSEKMTSLGQLVAGVAHEINNPIGAIYANVQPLKEYICDLQEALVLAHNNLQGESLDLFNVFLNKIDYEFVKDDLNSLLKSQQQAAERIKNIVLALRNFSRLDQGEIKSVFLEEGIDSTLQILHHEYKDKITLEKDYQLNKKVECYAGELNQVFMNILANAIQAIPDKGIIKITTYLIDKQAIITISDNGTGIPEEVKAHIFDPFFTTKEIGQGTGLGLSISYGIIEKHKGTLCVDSVPNEGTTFTISIPLSLIKN